MKNSPCIPPFFKGGEVRANLIIYRIKEVPADLSFGV